MELQLFIDLLRTQVLPNSHCAAVRFMAIAEKVLRLTEDINKTQITPAIQRNIWELKIILQFSKLKDLVCEMCRRNEDFACKGTRYSAWRMPIDVEDAKLPPLYVFSRVISSHPHQRWLALEAALDQLDGEYREKLFCKLGVLEEVNSMFQKIVEI